MDLIPQAYLLLCAFLDSSSYAAQSELQATNFFNNCFADPQFEGQHFAGNVFRKETPVTEIRFVDLGYFDYSTNEFNSQLMGLFYQEPL
jgi:hypothetical protein